MPHTQRRTAVSHSSQKLLALTGCVLFTGLFLFAPRPAWAKTLYVDAAGGQDANPCLAPTSACQTIGAAVNKAAIGDTVQVAKGTYLENLAIGMNLTVQGDAAGGTVIDGQQKDIVVTVGATAVVRLQHLTIQNGAGQEGGASRRTPRRAARRRATFSPSPLARLVTTVPAAAGGICGPTPATPFNSPASSSPARPVGRTVPGPSPRGAAK